MKNQQILFALAVLAIIISGLLIFNKSSKPQEADKTYPAADVQDNSGLEFLGNKGESLSIQNGSVSLATNTFETNKVKFFNTTLGNGKTVYYLVLKDAEGNFRAAANANQQCAQFKKGYTQEGNEIVCNTCQKRYPLADFATAQPDCNPKPISNRLTLLGNTAVILESDLDKIASLF